MAAFGLVCRLVLFDKYYTTAGKNANNNGPIATKVADCPVL
jgi:hypothetical protein